MLYFYRKVFERRNLGSDPANRPQKVSWNSEQKARLEFHSDREQFRWISQFWHCCKCSLHKRTEHQHPQCHSSKPMQWVQIQIGEMPPAKLCISKWPFRSNNSGENAASSNDGFQISYWAQDNLCVMKKCNLNLKAAWAAQKEQFILCVTLSSDQSKFWNCHLQQKEPSNLSSESCFPHLKSVVFRISVVNSNTAEEVTPAGQLTMSSRQLGFQLL